MAGSPVYSSRAAWLTTALIVIFLLCNFTSIPQYNTQVTTSSPISPSPPPSSPSLPHSELDKDPLRIYIPPSSPLHNNPLEDIWAGGSSQPQGDLPPDSSPQNIDSTTPPLPHLENCPIQPFDISKCPSVQRLAAHTNPLPGIKQPADRPLISYSYTESPTTRRNLQFFIAHGLHNGADFVFILNGDTDVDEEIIPKVPNVLVVKREETCSDLGAHVEVLKVERDEGRRPLRDSYSRFVLMSASVRGPFVPHWSRECWSEAYLGRLSDEVKLVGSTLNCNPTSTPSIPSNIWALDLVGLNILLSDDGLSSCYDSPSDVAEAESRAVSIIRGKEYKVDVMLSVFQTERDGKFVECKHEGDFMEEGGYFGGSVSPFETLFVTVGDGGLDEDTGAGAGAGAAEEEGKEGEEARDERKDKRGKKDIGRDMMIEKLGAWQGMSGYTSYHVCL